MRGPLTWLLLGVGLLVSGALPLLSGGARTATIAAGALLTLIAGTQLLKDEDDDYRRERPHPPGSDGGAGGLGPS